MDVWVDTYHLLVIDPFVLPFREYATCFRSETPVWVLLHRLEMNLPWMLVLVRRTPFVSSLHWCYESPSIGFAFHHRPPCLVLVIKHVIEYCSIWFQCKSTGIIPVSLDLLQTHRLLAHFLGLSNIDPSIRIPLDADALENEVPTACPYWSIVFLDETDKDPEPSDSEISPITWRLPDLSEARDRIVFEWPDPLKSLLLFSP